MPRNHWADDCDDEQVDRLCEKTVCRAFEVSVPVTIIPFAEPRKPKVKCLREIEITPGHIRCKSKDNRFKFTVTQKINVDIPIKFGAEVCYDEACTFDNGICDKVNDEQ